MTAASFFAETMRSSLQEVLSQALSTDWKVEVSAEETSRLKVEGSAFFGLLVTGTVSGKAGLLLAQADAALLARVFVGEPPEETGVFGGEQREAFEELLRQIFGVAATGLKHRFDEVWIEIDQAVPTAEPAQRITLLASSAFRPSPVMVELWLSAELADSLDITDQVPSAPGESAQRPAAPGTQPQSGPADLSVLAGVEVEIMLRFGQRRLPLREIATLCSGAVVELDESVAEPVEVLVGNRVIARGEIVGVDGCYGVRVAETSALYPANLVGERPPA